MKKESFKVEKGLPEGVFAHHVFHVYAPAVVQNLLPMLISVEAEVDFILCICRSRIDSEVVAFCFAGWFIAAHSVETRRVS